MKYIILFLIFGIAIVDNCLSNDRLHYELPAHKENAIKTMPNNNDARFAERMRRVEESRAKQVSMINERRLQNIEQQIITQQLGISNIKFVKPY